jgi:2-iminobutanoate/2-iminopropanoate deaminase
MSKAAIATDRAPAAIGPYSQALKAGDFVFTSGQIALDPRTGALVEGGIEPQTRQVLDNLSAVLEGAGAGWSDVVRTTIYLADLGDFALVNKLYGERVGAGVLPARSTVQVAGLPRGAAVEIDAVAYVPGVRVDEPLHPGLPRD